MIHGIDIIIVIVMLNVMEIYRMNDSPEDFIEPGKSDQCECGGKMEYDHFDDKIHYESWKCTKCGAVNTPEAM